MNSTPIVIGSTGLVGSQILQQLVSSSQVSTVHALMRRTFPNPINDPDSKLKPLISTDTLTWPAALSATASTILFSALGSTRADSGSLEAQRKIDVDLNVAVARTAKESGVKTYVLISSNGASSALRLPYLQMKGELEDAMIALGFDKTVILRPGLIVGGREKSRIMEQPFHHIANLFGVISGGRLKDFWAQDADVIARAAIRAGLEDSVWEGKVSEGGKKVWILTQADIVALGMDQKKV